MQFLLEDYILNYIIKYNICDAEDEQIEKIITLIKLVLNMRYEKGVSIYDKNKNDYIKLFIIKINWLERNLLYMKNIILIYLKINKIIAAIHLKSNENNDYLINKTLDFLKNETNRKNLRIKEYQKEINEIISLLFKGLLKILFSEEVINNVEEKKYYEFVNNLKNIFEIADKINETYKLNIAEIYLFKDYLELENAIHQKKYDKNVINKIIILLRNNYEFTEKEEFENLKNNIKSFHRFLNENIEEKNLLNETIIRILTSQFKIIQNIRVRESIFEIVISDNDLIMNSFDIIEMIFRDNVSSLENKIKNKTEEFKTLNNEIIQLTEKNDNPILEEILLLYFEKIFLLYFENLKNENLSLELFDINAKNLEKYLDGGEENENIRKKIVLLYSISYVRLYIYQFITKITLNYKKKQIGENYEEKDYSKIIDAINSNSGSSFREMLRLYMYKIIFNQHGRNFETFQSLNLHYIYQINENLYSKFYNEHNKKQEFAFNYFFLPSNDKDIKNFEEQLTIFQIQYQNSFETGNIEQFQKNINLNGIDTFFILSVNFVLSNMYQNDYINQSESPYTNFCRFTSSILKMNEIQNERNNLFSLFINKDNYYKMKSNKQINGNKEILEKILYCMRICLNCEDITHENLYRKLLSKNCINEIKNNYFPGNENQENDLIKLYEQLINHFNTKNSTDGAYACECGNYYFIPAPGILQKKSCNKCNKKLNNKVSGFYRIFKNEKELSDFNSINISTINTINLPSNYELKTLDWFYEKYIKPIYKKEKCGIVKVSKNYFLKNDKKIRNLTQISYRILNFILYSHIFFAEELGFINDIKSYIPDGMTILEVLTKDWELLENELNNNRIRNIRIFMNLIIKDVTNKLKNIEKIRTIDERNEIEGQINEIINKKINEYEKYEEIYTNLNNKYRSLDLLTIQNLFNEINDVSLYSDKKFPLYKYFLYCNYPNMDILKQKIDLEDSEHIKYYYQRKNYLMKK